MLRNNLRTVDHVQVEKHSCNKMSLVPTQLFHRIVLPTSICFIRNQEASFQQFQDSILTWDVAERRPQFGIVNLQVPIVNSHV